MIITNILYHLLRFLIRFLLIISNDSSEGQTSYKLSFHIAKLGVR